MTTLPPESNDGQNAAQNGAEQTGADLPVPPQPEAPAYEQPAAPVPPQAPEAPPQAPQAAPQYEAPPAGAYQQPQAGYQQPQQGYQQPQAAGDPAGTITLNYWLSVFFTWIPALIFYIIEKGKGQTPSYKFHVANLNFSLLRIGVVIAAYILTEIPVIGWLLGLLLWLGGVVLFVFHIIAAVKAPEAYRRGGEPEFILNIPLVK